MSTPRALAIALGFSAFIAFANVAQAANTEISATAAAQIRALNTIKISQTAAQRKIDSRLLLAALHQRNDSRLALLTDFRFIKPDVDGRVRVDIALADARAMKDVLNAIESLGGETIANSRAYRMITADVRLDNLESLAITQGLGMIREHIRGMTNASSPPPNAAAKSIRNLTDALPNLIQATNVSEGDATHGADEARAYFGTNGSGVKVCVLSDGIDSLAALQASGDLPAVVDVLPGQAGSGDEGSAMLEIIHDLAPGAALGFATAGPDEATFAQNILDLATAGCNIIVDDIIYLDESPFQDGPVAQSVNTVTGNGVIFFSSAGNEGNRDDDTSGTWEGDFLASAAADPSPLSGANLHNFGDGGNSIQVTAASGAPVILTWAEHYDLAGGIASTDYDVYIMNGALTTIFDASTDVQDGSGGDDRAFEYVGGGTFSNERILIDRFALGSTSSAPMFNLIVFRGTLDSALATAGATRGHSAAASAFSTAATPAALALGAGMPTGPYPGLFTATDLSETFSSDGTRRIILSPTGAELTPGNRTSTGGVVRQKPEITAADGVATAAPGFNPFFGTSAAAPHAAAIAALIKSAVPAITPAQLRTALVSSAIDIEAAGTDRNTGAGIIMARAALQAAGAVPIATLDGLVPVPTQIAGDGDAFIETNEDWSLSIPLQNIGGGNATAINAVLSTTTPGISIYSANSSYADLAVGATAANDRAYVFNVGPGASCGQAIDFILTVTYTGGSSPQAFNYSVSVGSAGTPVTTSYTGPVVPIPDGADLSGTAPGAPVDATLAVAGSANIYDVHFSIDGATCNATAGSTTVGIDHSFVNDLELTLLSPDGTAVKIVDNTDGSGNNLCQTVLDDQSVGASIQTVASAQAPFTGSFKPNLPLAAFNGKNVSGNWILRAQDFFSQDSGNIRAWSLTVTPALCDAPLQPAQLSATKAVSGGPVYTEGANITYTIVVTNTGTGIQPDNAGDEFSDLLPVGLTAGTATASSGAVVSAGNLVTWNGQLMPGASVTLTIPATINAGTSGTTLSNQATLNFDADRNGSNEASALSDDPSTATANDPTSIFVGQGTLTISPTAAAFGNQGINTASAPITITLGNSGTASLDVTALTAATAPFSRVGGTCAASPPIMIAASGSCTLSYQFAPTATGPFSQNISVTANAPGSGTIALSGNGVQGMLSVSPTLVNFPDLYLGASSNASTTIGNTGAGALQVISIDVPIAPFSVVGGTCGSAPFALAPSTSCTIDYQFTPAALGTFTQSLTLVSDAGTATIGLNGSAIIVPIELPTLSESARWALGLLLFGIALVSVRRRVSRI